MDEDLDFVIGRLREELEDLDCFDLDQLSETEKFAISERLDVLSDENKRQLKGMLSFWIFTGH